MTFYRIVLTISVLSCLSVGVLGCTSGSGDPCKEENDCSGSLLCCKEGTTATERGTCQAACGTDTLPADSGMQDGAASDGGSQTDGSVADAG